MAGDVVLYVGSNCLFCDRMKKRIHAYIDQKSGLALTEINTDGFDWNAPEHAWLRAKSGGGIPMPPFVVFNDFLYSGHSLYHELPEDIAAAP